MFLKSWVMRSSYKPLGAFIHKVENRNTDAKITNLLGLSMTKEFRKSTSNIIGTDLSVYKIVDQWQFACDFMSVIRVLKLPIVLQFENESIIVSPAYTVFEIIDTNLLLPEYLMMWFRRSEFDRYAYFRCDSAVRGGFNWNELCEVELPVPSIIKQKEIVEEYNTIVNRIVLNETLNQKLEETAQALYKHWFVDFEFPNKEGNPYKSFSGQMVFNEGLGMEIPFGWAVKDYESVLDFKTGKLNSNAATKDGKYPFFTCSSETFKTNTYSFDKEAILLAGNNASAIYPFKYFKGKFDAYQRTYVIGVQSDEVSIYQAFFTIQNELEGFKGSSSGTTTKFLTMKLLNSLKILVCNEFITSDFKKICSPLFERMQLTEKVLEQLNDFKILILSKMSKVETEKEVVN